MSKQRINLINLNDDYKNYLTVKLALDIVGNEFVAIFPTLKKIRTVQLRIKHFNKLIELTQKF